MKYLFLLSIFLFTFQQGFAQDRNFDYLDIFDLQMVADPQISPDGEQIVYVRHQFDIMEDKRYTNLWIINFDGSNHRPLTSGKNNYSSVRWSPDGKRIAYITNEEGKSEIFVRYMETGEVASITNLQYGPSDLSWHPEGKYLLFSKRIPQSRPSIASIPSAPSGANWSDPAVEIEHVRYRADGKFGFVREGFRQLFIISPEGGAHRQISSGNSNHNSVSWAPEGKSVVFTSDRSGEEDLIPNRSHIYELDIYSGELNQLTEKAGPHSGPVVSPDGSRIAYVSFQDKFKGYQQRFVYLMKRDGSGQRVLTENTDFDPSSLSWSSDSRNVIFRYVHEGDSRVGSLNLDGSYFDVTTGLGAPTMGRPYGGGNYTVSQNGRVAFPKVTATRAPELAVVQVGRNDSRLITDINGEFFKSRKVGEVEEFWVQSSTDDFKVHSWLIYPPDFDQDETYPLILEIHGGPHTNYGPRFSPELQLMASQGYVVLYTNPRGSTSYGPEFASYINFNYPSEDHDDLMDAVDYVLEKGFIDSDRLYVTGGSGGGVLTAWAIGKTDRFAAAVVSKPVINWHSFVISADLYPFFTKYWFTAMPWEDPDQYHARSPLSLVGNVNTPTMLLTGELDYRTPMAESEQYYNALKLRGVDASLVRIQNEAHNMITRPSNLIRKVGYIVGWFDRYGGEER